MKPLILSLASITLLAAVGTAAAKTDSRAENTVPAATGVPASPGSYDQQFQAARDLAISGQREEAIRAYSKLLVRSPGNADALLGRGQVYAWMGRWREAEDDLRAATAASPGYTGAWSALGNMYLWSDRPTQATEAFEHWLKLSPNDPAPRIARGRAYRAAGIYVAARADFEAAAALGADAGQVKDYLQSLTPRAQNPDVVVPAGYLWSASLSTSLTEFTHHARSDWSDETLSLRRHFERGSLAAEFLNARRFSTNDQAWALDGYVDLWNRAYANLRYQYGPEASLFPGRSWRAELFQGVGQGWELSGSYDRLDFTGSNVDMYGIGVGKYVGNYYLRERHLYVHTNDSNGNSDQLLVRYYYAGDGDNYVEVRAGAGYSNQIFAGNPEPSTTRSSSVSLAFVKYLSPRWGIKLGANWGDEVNSFVGRGVSAALYTRW